MKKTYEIITGYVIIILLVIITVFKFGNLFRPINTDMCIKSIDTFHNMPENSIEVIGYGSSHMWRGIDPMEMYSNYGIGLYNYGCNWQTMNTTLLFLKDSLRTQLLKIILVETFKVNEYQHDTNINGEIYYTKAIDEFDGKKQYLKQCFGKDYSKYMSYYIPFIAFHDNWSNISKESFISDSTYDTFL